MVMDHLIDCERHAALVGGIEPYATKICAIACVAPERRRPMQVD